MRQPTPEDQYSLDPWTVGWTGTDPVGRPGRRALDPWQHFDRLAELGACPEQAAEGDYNFVQLQQLALDHLID